MMNDDSAIPAFLRNTASRLQAEELEAFKCAIRNGDMDWIVADYPVDKACSPGQCLGMLAARLFARMTKRGLRNRPRRVQ